MLEPEKEEIQIYEEDGIRFVLFEGEHTWMTMHVDGKPAQCFMCWEDVPAALEIRQHDSVNITLLCEGCFYRAGSLFDPRNRNKELCNGLMGERPGAELE